MLGREHEADLEREALKRQRAAELAERPDTVTATRRNERLRSHVHLLLARLAAFVGRTAHEA